MNNNLSTNESSELIITKSNQLKALALLAQGNCISELQENDIDSLFSLVSSVSEDIANLAKENLKDSKTLAAA